MGTNRIWTTCALALSMLACDGGPPARTGPPRPVDGGVGIDGGASIDAGIAADAGASPLAVPLAVRTAPDPARAEAGRAFLESGWPGRPVLPKLALQNLWLVWGTGRLEGAALFDEIERRYGLTRRPGEAWPVGLRDDGGPSLSFDCLLCHASRGTEPGEVWIGVGNARLNLERLYDDLLDLADTAERFGLGPFPVPYDLAGVSGAPGAVDGTGLGMRFAGTIDDLGETFGYQQAPAWWTMRYKAKLYTDGSGRTDNWRTMMSTLFSFGLTQSEIMAHDDDFQDLRHYLLSLEPPAWPFPPPAASDVEAGRAVFARDCAGCHGTYGEGAPFPDRVVDTAEVGTDPVREVGMDAFQVAAINASWYGQPAAWDETAGYLAPALVGVWATAPYLHNGSVPDLAGLLDPAQRPDRWRYADDLAYDPSRAGWAYETTGPAAAMYDTTAPSLSNAGHLYGASLSDEERRVLVEYLKTL